MDSLIPVSPPSQQPAAVCVPMPSAESARAWMAGAPDSLVPLLLSYAGRTAVVAAGMYAAGKRQHLWRDAAAGTAVIELVLLSYFNAEQNRKTPNIPSQQHVQDWLQGKPGSFPPLIIDVIARTLEISAGIAFAGTKSHTFRDAFAGSLAVQTFITVYSIMMGSPCPQSSPTS